MLNNFDSAMYSRSTPKAQATKENKLDHIEIKNWYTSKEKATLFT